MQPVVAFVLGLLVFVLPEMIGTWLLWPFVAYLLFDGATSLWMAFTREPAARPTSMTVVRGVLSFAVAAMAAAWPANTASSLLFVLTLWVAGQGLVHMSVAARTESRIERWRTAGPGLLCLTSALALLVMMALQGVWSLVTYLAPLVALAALLAGAQLRMRRGLKGPRP